MRLTDMSMSKAFIIIWAGLPSFLWFRGVWRDNGPDRLLAGLVFLVLALLAVAVDGTTYPLNTAGGVLVIVGILTLLVGPLGKRMPFGRAADYGVVCIILGVLLTMLL
jgi:hypothetical protein